MNANGTQDGTHGQDPIQRLLEQERLLVGLERDVGDDFRRLRDNVNRGDQLLAEKRRLEAEILGVIEDNKATVDRLEVNQKKISLQRSLLKGSYCDVKKGQTCPQVVEDAPRETDTPPGSNAEKPGRLDRGVVEETPGPSNVASREAVTSRHVWWHQGGRFAMPTRPEPRTTGIRFEPYIPPKPRMRGAKKPEKNQESNPQPQPEPEPEPTEISGEEQLNPLRDEPSLFVGGDVDGPDEDLESPTHESEDLLSSFKKRRNERVQRERQTSTEGPGSEHRC